MNQYGGNWSFSSLNVYETCAHRFKLARIDRSPEPPRPPDNPMERGNRIHKNFEDFITGALSSLANNEAKAIKEFLTIAEHLRLLYQCGMVTVEDDWLFNRDWDEATKGAKCEKHTHFAEDCEDCQRRVWLWAKLDWCVLDRANLRVVVGDWKSGKSMYKAIEHVQQLQLYVAIAALKYPWAETLIAELHYVDEGHVKPFRCTREEALRFVNRFDVRADRIYQDRFFRANPSNMACKWCPYGTKNGTGVCPVAA